MVVVPMVQKICNVNTRLQELLSSNVAKILRKINVAYLTMVRLYGHTEIWGNVTVDGVSEPILPPIIMKEKRKMRLLVDGLSAFIEDEDQVELDETASMSFDEFKKQYLNYRRNENLERLRFTEDHYANTFKAYNLEAPKGRDRKIFGVKLAGARGQSNGQETEQADGYWGLEG
jgi:hypothetical protein